MRIPSPRLVRLASLVGGGILEAGDAELLISPVIQPAIEVPAPTDKVYGTGTLAPSPLSDSGFKSEAISQIGAQAAVNTLIFNFLKGIWRLTCTASVMFTGTTASSAYMGLNLVDPDSVAANLMAWPQITGLQQSNRLDVTIVFQRDNFQVRLACGATVAGDILSLDGQCFARRLV